MEKLAISLISSKVLSLTSGKNIQTHTPPIKQPPAHMYPYLGPMRT